MKMFNKFMMHWICMDVTHQGLKIAITINDFSFKGTFKQCPCPTILPVERLGIGVKYIMFSIQLQEITIIVSTSKKSFSIHSPVIKMIKFPVF